MSDLVIPKNDEENKRLCDWAAQKIGQDEFTRARAIGFADKSGLIGAVVLHDLSLPNVFLSWAFLAPGAFNRRVIATIYNWAYIQLGCTRITGLVERNNKKARKIDEGIGMKLEGVLRKAAPSGRDLMVYGLLKTEAEELIKRLYAAKFKKTTPVQSHPV